MPEPKTPPAPQAPAVPPPASVAQANGPARRKPDPVMQTTAQMDRTLSEMEPKNARSVARWLYERYGRDDTPGGPPS